MTTESSLTSSDLSIDTASAIFVNFKEVFGEFTSFLLEKKVFDLALAFVISANVNRITTDFVDNIISPIINRFFSSDQDKLKDATISIFGIKFEIGNFISSLIKVSITLFILYYVFKYITKYTKKEEAKKN